MKASDLFIKVLENHGVGVIYGVPWEENLDLLDSIKKSSIDFIVTRHEQTAVFMAATYWRLTWKIGVALATLWPWATNMVTGVAYATLWWMPVMVITWQKPIKHSKQWKFQIIDIVSMMKPITKYSKEIVYSSDILYILNNAIRIATEERPWAVAIELPEDVAWEKVKINKDILIVKQNRRPIIDKKILEILKEELEKVKSPIILIWAWANRKLISKHLTKFIEKYNIPFFTSQMWKWVVDERLSQCIWTAAITYWDYIHDAISKGDLIISVWYDDIEKPTNNLWFNGIKTININFNASDIDSVYSPYLDIIWDIWTTFLQLNKLKINNTKWNHKKIYSITEKNNEKIEKNLKFENKIKVMMPRRLVKDLRESMWEDDILTLDNWLYKIWIARNYKAYNPNTVILDNALASMWAWLATAIEAKRINQDKNIVCVTWDWWLVMNLWDLETVVRLKLDLVVIVLNNSSYGMIKWKQKEAWFSDYWLDFWNPDFVKLALSFWWVWYKVKNKNDFKWILEISMKNKWLNIIDLDFEYPKEIK